MASLPAPVSRVTPIIWTGSANAGQRHVAEEVPVALVYDASTEAVMMATPADLEDFAYGFSLNEGLISQMEDIRRLDIVPGPNGIEARMWLTPAHSQAMTARRRSRTGPTGCGLCGLDSLEEVLRLRTPIRPSALRLTASDIMAAVTSLETRQPLGDQTRAVHAAGFWMPREGLVAVREDVGRHNALDKLAGALARTGVRGETGAIVLTSRISVEMVQKAAAIGAPVLIAISAPTALALRTAEAAGLTVIAVARHNGFEVFTHPERIVLADS
ncbi:formate dehydrogenase accessory sulfurtransferase FdhD [Asticcacaulis sp.]|uniref:formate dehydrogenase accessory sulfurtransferase FdhD n=1 Tax=Asticcacaulis sp. TaxID=1872648 RepID=UPI003F7C00C7